MKHESVVKAEIICYDAIILESECDEECVARLILQEMEEMVEAHAKKKKDLRKIEHVKL